MLTLSEYLKSQKEDLRVRMLIYIIGAFSTGIVPMSLLQLNGKIESKLLELILAASIPILVSIVVLLYLYILYTYRMNDFRSILKNYKQDNQNGYMINLENNDLYCLNCLYSENHNEIKLIKYGDKWICPIKNCNSIYPKSPPKMDIKYVPRN